MFVTKLQKILKANLGYERTQEELNNLIESTKDELQYQFQNEMHPTKVMLNEVMKTLGFVK